MLWLPSGIMVLQNLTFQRKYLKKILTSNTLYYELAKILLLFELILLTTRYTDLS